MFLVYFYTTRHNFQMSLIVTWSVGMGCPPSRHLTLGRLPFGHLCIILQDLLVLVAVDTWLVASKIFTVVMQFFLICDFPNLSFGEEDYYIVYMYV